MPSIVKSNLMELNRTQSVDWVRLSSAIERNRTPDFQWVRFPNKSNSSHKSNSIEHNLMDWVRLALVNLYKASPKQAHQSRFYNLFNNRNPIYKLSTAVKRTEQNKAIIIPAGLLCKNTSKLLTAIQATASSRWMITKLSKHLQATGKQPVHVEGDLIDCARLRFGMHGLSRLFSLKPWKLRHPLRQSGIPGSLLLRIWSLQSITHLKLFLRNFFVYE